jgi:hypothetical protein
MNMMLKEAHDPDMRGKRRRKRPSISANSERITKSPEKRE